MTKLTDIVLKRVAKNAEKAFFDALGLASRSGVYEPEMTAEVKTIKAMHTSKVEKFFNKLVK